MAPKDLKAALGNNSKPDITHVRKAFAVYTARACGYGDIKYERANYRRPTGGVVHTTPTREDFERYRAYLRAAVSHLMETLDAMEMHQALDPQLTDVEGMKRAAYAVDTDVTPGAKVGASMLPHVSPACASLNMAITQAVDCGLLPRDPGTPWDVATTEPAKREPKVGDRVRVTVGDNSFTDGGVPVGTLADITCIDAADPHLPYQIKALNPAVGDDGVWWVHAVEVVS